VGYRADERFPMCSTFKALLVAAVLEKVQAGALTLDQKIAYGSADLLEYAPITRPHAAAGALPLNELCAAAVELSDNTAANLLLRMVGGPVGLTARLRAWGDPKTRLDRNEPSLNSSIPGDPRDTTTPHAMAETLRRLLAGRATLQPAARALLLDWMRNCQTGKNKLRAGIHAPALIGDKTGNNGHDTCGDNAIVDLPNRKPIFISAYLTQAKVDAKAQDAILAKVAENVMSGLADFAGAGDQNFAAHG
jgi:beta-lactamase class A